MIRANVPLNEKLDYIKQRNCTLKELLTEFFGGDPNMTADTLRWCCAVRVLGIDMGSTNMAVDDIGFSCDAFDVHTFAWSLVNVCGDGDVQSSLMSSDEVNRCVVRYFQQHSHWARNSEAILDYDFITIELQPPTLNIKTTIASYSLWTLIEEVTRQFLADGYGVALTLFAIHFFLYILGGTSAPCHWFDLCHQHSRFNLQKPFLCK